MRGSTLLAAMSVLLVALLNFGAPATDAELYFSSDRNGQSRVTWVQEGDSVFIVVIDNDENLDCDIRDKFFGRRNAPTSPRSSGTGRRARPANSWPMAHTPT